jgi:hypothetical protein
MTLRKLNRCSVLILAFAFAVVAEAQDITGTWAIQDLQIANKVQLSFSGSLNGKGSFNSSSGFDISQLRGLNLAQVTAPVGTMVRFDLVREAGTFACEGYFKGGNGAGTFVFRPDPTFLSQMRGLGFLDIDESRLLMLAIHDVGPRFASEVRANGVAVSKTDELVAMRIHGVTIDFIRSMQQLGLKPEQEDLVKMRIHGVTPDFANNVKQMYSSASIEDLVKMRIHGVALDFARDVRQVYPTASIEDLVKLRIHGVTMDYIRNAQSRSRDISLDQVVRLKIRGLD